MKNVVKKKNLKLSKVSIIYLISDSKWVSPDFVVPRKRGVIVIKDENNELIPTRTIMVSACVLTIGSGTIFLAVIHQMLERLAKNSYFCYLDWYSCFS